MDSLNKTIQFLKEALVDEPDNIELRFRLASTYFQNSELEKAIKQCQIILKTHPENKEALMLLQHCQEKHTGTMEKNTLSENNESLPSIDSSNSTPTTDLPNKNSQDLQKYIEKAKITFSDVGGMQELKEEVKLGIIYPFEKPELYAKYGKKTGGGLLLYGPPGCGKTYIARATAGEIEAMFMSISIDDVLDMYIGQSEKRLHQLFQTAREVKPTVLFFDEIDALGIDRMKVSSAASIVVNQFLVEMDGIDNNNDQVMIIGATNTPWQIDSAFQRPGRFDKIIFVPPPDEAARAEIFKIYLKDKPTENIDYVELAKKTNLYSGADIAKIVDSAIERVMKEVISGKPERDITMKDLTEVINKTSPSTKDWFATAKNFARYANESGNYTPVLQYIKEQGL